MDVKLYLQSMLEFPEMRIIQPEVSSCKTVKITFASTSFHVLDYQISVSK